MAAKKKIREQERELIRKEKALAEAAIIITAQKKFLRCFRTPRTIDSRRATRWAL
jgi:hypothetical protein